MIDHTTKIFYLPKVPYEQKLQICLSIMTKQHQELIPLRRAKKSYHLQFERLKQEIQKWREKYQKTKGELKKIQKENTLLKQEIERLTKSNKRYQVALFDHGNFKSPNDSNKKNKGGQRGHADTNREKQEDYSSYQRQRLFAHTCGKCGHALSRVSSNRQKILLDIVIHPELVKLIIESERQWCGTCKLEVNARDSRSFPFTEYGINTFLLVMLLRFKCHASLSNIAAVISISHGLTLAKSDVSNILTQAKTYLQSRYDQLIQEIRQEEVIYVDETGWLIHGQKAWLWIMVSEGKTLYYAAESRGKGIVEELYGDSHAYVMHDGLASYEKSILPDKTLYCWAHLLRFAYEETIDSPSPWCVADKFRRALVEIYHLKDQLPIMEQDTLEKILRQRITELINQKTRSISIMNIQNRLRKQKEGLITALVETPDGTNNVAERELRPMVIHKRISYGSDACSGMETTALLASIIQTASQKQASLLPSLQRYLQTGVQEKYSQYLHIPFDDS